MTGLRFKPSSLALQQTYFWNIRRHEEDLYEQQPCQNTFTQPSTQMKGHKSWPQEKWTWREWYYRLRSVMNRRLNNRQMVMITMYQMWKFLWWQHLKATSLILTTNPRGSVAGTTAPFLSDLGKLRERYHQLTHQGQPQVGNKREVIKQVFFFHKASFLMHCPAVLLPRWAAFRK